jgi:hypothetical protein
MTSSNKGNDMTTNEARRTVSIQWVKYEDGSYGIELVISGLNSLEEAEAGIDHIERKLCGQPIATH